METTQENKSKDFFKVGFWIAAGISIILVGLWIYSGYTYQAKIAKTEKENTALHDTVTTQRTRITTLELDLNTAKLRLLTCMEQAAKANTENVVNKIKLQYEDEECRKLLEEQAINYKLNTSTDSELTGLLSRLSRFDSYNAPGWAEIDKIGFDTEPNQINFGGSEVLQGIQRRTQKNK